MRLRLSGSLRLLSTVGIPLLLVAVLGCDKDKKIIPPPPPPPPGPFLARTSPENLLYNLQVAYEHKNIEEYILLFADDFAFVFDSLDIQNDTLDTPESWGLVDEIEAHRRLFGEPDIEEIKLDLILGARLEPIIPNTDARILVQNAFLEVTQRLPSGEPLFLKYQAGEQWFHFRRTNETTAEGGSIWVIVRWEDKGHWWRCKVGLLLASAGVLE